MAKYFDNSFYYKASNGTLVLTGTLSGNATIGTNSGDTRFSLNSANQYTMVLKNAGNIAGNIGNPNAAYHQNGAPQGYTHQRILNHQRPGGQW